jgi:hypothetical protein
MNRTLRGVIVAVVIVGLLLGAVGAVRWARRGGTAANLAASALLLTFGLGLVVTHPQRNAQQVQEQRDRRTGENGDPPWLTEDGLVVSVPKADESAGSGPAAGLLTAPLRWRARIVAAIRRLGCGQATRDRRWRQEWPARNIVQDFRKSSRHD